MKDVKVVVKDLLTGESLHFDQIKECARYFNLSQKTITNRIRGGVIHGRRWLFMYADEKRQKIVKRRESIERKGEKVFTGTVPVSLVPWKQAAKGLGITPERLYAIVKEKGIKGFLYVDECSFYPRRYYRREDIEAIKTELELKHNAAWKTIIAFNKDVNDGRIYHFINIYICRCTLQKKFGVNIPIKILHRMLKDGSEFQGWYIDEEA